MNKADRKELQRAIDLMEEVRHIVQTIKDGEQDKFDNLPEGLQQSERGEQFETNVSALEDVDGSIDSVIDGIEDAINS